MWIGERGSSWGGDWLIGWRRGWWGIECGRVSSGQDSGI